MSSANRIPTLPPGQAGRLNPVCDHFEKKWLGGDVPRLEEFLHLVEEVDRPALLRELLLLEIHYRRRRGECPCAAEYRESLPEWADFIAAFFASPTDAGGEDQVPARLGHYRVDSILGKGGFGVVYKGYDEELLRAVAIKVPRRDRLSSPEDADAFLAEARIVARLEHPHIVPVLNVGHTEDGLCFVVSRFISGSDLAQQIKVGRPAASAAAALVASVAEALHYAHLRGLVHRDVKPANVVLDQDGTPYLADFGLALKEQDYGKVGGIWGTPAYLSPEQAKGEGHRVDGRSDVFSLGVVFYELLTGRRPFHGDTMSILRMIVADEPRPPRQVDDAIPRELERICLKALSKRASDRYLTAKDLAEDLRYFLHQAPPVLAGSTTDSQPPIKIVPKGLRSFDSHDADFFLELLPGPRDREGLPDTVRFWKTRIEETDPEKTFAVGLICGPSGCGKSSLVKAGLLPRLSDAVISVYVEATAQRTETQLLTGLRKRCPGLPAHLELKEALEALRRGQGIPAGQKVLIVLDQFEQWLHASRSGEQSQTDLVQALRQCNGSPVQCVVLVRDDFWMAVIRFMRELEIRLLEGQNSAALDLFPIRHAEKVLAAFGRAFGALPESSSAVSNEQKEFVEQAVRGLAQEGKVVCVRLALFAEMMKDKSWTPPTLKAMGGAEGVGVTFLEETFGAATAPPEHRYHQKAARAVLKALLPEAGSDIKGHLRSHNELLAASGYGGRPREFDDLLRILDSEIRLLTPTDPEGQEGSEPGASATGVFGEPGASATGEESPVADAPGSPAPGEKFYQLTHDYLVPSLREWLTRKQKETRRGRAELLLADRAAVWNARPENRQLPSLLQWWQICRLTRKKSWAPPQRKMMGQAMRYHLRRGLLLTALLVLLCLAGWDGFGRLEARRLRGLVLNANTAEVPAIVEGMAAYRWWLNPLLREAYAQAERDNDRTKQLHASLSLAPVDPAQRDYLYDRLLEAQAQEVMPIRRGLVPYQAELSERLWAILADRKADLDRRFRAACALASYVPEDPLWEQVSADVAAHLVNQEASVLGTWCEALQPVGTSLLPPLASFLEDETRQGLQRRVIANLYKTFAKGQQAEYARLEKVLLPLDKAAARYDIRTKAVKKQANVGVALMAMGRGEKVWQLLKHSPDPTLRSFLIERLGLGGVEPKVLLRHFDQEPDPSIKPALLLSLGEFGLDHLPEVERRNFMPRLERLYRDDPDAGIHGAAEWLLRQWQKEDELSKVEQSLPRGKFEFKGKDWCVTREGHTMVLVRKPPGEVSAAAGNRFRKERIDYSYAIGAKEVTLEQFLRFRKDHESWYKANNSPVNRVTWYEAAAYCNWLSAQEGVPMEQWCYLPNEQGVRMMVSAVGQVGGLSASRPMDSGAVLFLEGKTNYLQPAPNHLRRTGYRLPTEAEWEHACRAGATTSYCFGEPWEDLLGKYAWFGENSKRKSHPVGLLKPNDLGLFDVHGNLEEWCDDWADKGASRRVFRGGDFGTVAEACTSAFCSGVVPSARFHNIGLRLARVSVGATGE